MDLPYPVRFLPLLLLGATSCSVGSTGQLTSLAPAESCLTGTVFSVGTDFAPATILRLDAGGESRITGNREDQIRFLTGAVVTVCGPVTTDARTIEVQSFELRAVDGMTAYLGTLQEIDGAWQLKPDGNGVPVPLSGVPDQLREAEGSLVWVAGTWADQAFSVKSFGLMGRS